MLANDSSTIAVEIPIWLTEDEISALETRYGIELAAGGAPRTITGHIDFLQVRNDAVHILDYKPDARTNKPIAQLAIYALALTMRVPGLKLFDIKCAWFNEEEYNEFFPRTLFAKHSDKDAPVNAGHHALLIFFRQHDRHHAAGFLSISRVFRMPAQIAIVIVDLRKERLAVMLNADEIMLTPRIVLIIESIESLDLLEDRIVAPYSERSHAGRHHDAATPESFPEGIVQCASLRALGIFILFPFQSHSYQPPSRYRRPTVRRRTRPRLPFLPSYSIAAVPRGARPAAPRLDRPRRAATERDRARRRDIIRCRGHFS